MGYLPPPPPGGMITASDWNTVPAAGLLDGGWRALTIHIGRHDYLLAEATACSYCSHTSPLRDLRGGCVACGGPMAWFGQPEIPSGAIEVTALGDAEPRFILGQARWGETTRLMTGAVQATGAATEEAARAMEAMQSLMVGLFDRLPPPPASSSEWR